MHPIICQIGPFTIYSYGLMLAVAFLVSSFLMRKQAERQNVNPDIIFNLAFTIFICGILGARLLYIIEHLGFYIKNPLEIIMLPSGGLSWFGGLIFGVSFGIIYLKKKNLPIYKTFDLVVPFVALGQAIGRIGCLLNGCCFGKVTDKFGLYFKTHEAVLIPTQIYASLLLILIFIILKFLQDKPHREGQIFFVYLLLYSLKRFFIEFWRADNETIFLNLSLFQVLSILMFIIGSLGLLLIKKSNA